LAQAAQDEKRAARSLAHALPGAHARPHASWLARLLGAAWQMAGTQASGVAAALAVVPEELACRRLCDEVLGSSRRWGPPEQRALVDQLPLILHRLYTWLGLGNIAIEEGLFRIFSPAGPLAAHLAGLGSPSFVFPVQRLPPRVLRAAAVSAMPGFFGGPGRGGGVGGIGSIGGVGNGLGGDGAYGSVAASTVSPDLGSDWFNLLGPTRVVRSPAGNIEGLRLTAHEFMLTCLVHFLVCEQPPTSTIGAQSAGRGSGTGSRPLGNSFGGASDALGSSGLGAPSGYGGGLGSISQWGGAPFGGSSLGRGGRTPGTISIALERLLLAHLEAHLQHSEYELAFAHEPRAARFFLCLLHEFLFSPRPAAEGMPASARSPMTKQDMRAQPAALHATRVVAIHVLSNPALRRECEESMSGYTTSVGRSARLTREVALLGFPIVELIIDMLVGVTATRQAGLDALTSLTRLWLVLLQPWKATRLKAWYSISRSPESKPDPPPGAPLSQYAPAALSGAGRPPHSPDQQLDVALVGMEPESAPGASDPAPPHVPRGSGPPVAAPHIEGQGFAERLFTANLTMAAMVPLVPGTGDGYSWRGYVAKFSVAYFLLEAVLTAPAHRTLCLAMCRRLAGTNVAGLVAAVGLGAADGAVAGSTQPQSPTSGSAAPGSAAAGVGAALGDLLRQPNDLLRQRHIMAALKTIAQVLLCFTDSALVQVLEDLPQIKHTHPATPLFAGTSAGGGAGLCPEIVLAVKLAWAALLAGVHNTELQPLLCAVSRQLSLTPQWLSHGLPAVEDHGQYRPFAQLVLQETGDCAPPSLQKVASAAHPEFVGSEWQRPVRGGEAELILQVTYWVALMVDWLLGRTPRTAATSAMVLPQTEWPRMFANWKLTSSVFVMLLLAVLW